MRNQMFVRTAAWVAVVSMTGPLVACGEEADADSAEGSDRITVEPGEDEGHDHSTHDHGETDMAGMTGDPEATPAQELPDAELRQGSFEALPDAPQDSPEVAGEAFLARTADGTTLSVDLSGLEAGAEYTSHLHVEACEPHAGGDHFKFDAGGSDQPPNEVHLAIEADEDGGAATTITSDNPDSQGAKSMVLHLADGTKFACADLGG